MQARAYAENEQELFKRDPVFFGVTKQHRRLVTEAARVSVPHSALDDIIWPALYGEFVHDDGRVAAARAWRLACSVCVSHCREPASCAGGAARRVLSGRYRDASKNLVLRVSGAVEKLFRLELSKKTELVCAALQQQDVFDVSMVGGRERKAHLLRASRLRVDEDDLRRALRVGKAFAIADETC